MNKSILKINLKLNEPWRSAYISILTVLSNYLEGYLVVTDSYDATSIGIENSGTDIFISKDFLCLITKNIFNHKNIFVHREPLIRLSDGRPDYLSTCLYMVNCFQELVPDRFYDNLGRFKYESSFQFTYKCPERRLVNEYFDSFCEVNMKKMGLKRKIKPSIVFLSHDIDSIYNSVIQDGGNLIKTLKIGKFLKLVHRNLKGNYDWDNLIYICDLHDKFGYKSTFFIQPLHSPKYQISRVRNSDYQANKPKFKEMLTQISNRGFHIGIHKSISNLDLSEQIKNLPDHEAINRNHFLKFKIPDHWEELDNANIIMDFSLGFAETIGYRNSYSLPFRPYNIIANKSHNHISVPLNIMDATFFNYSNKSLDAINSDIIKFLNNSKNDAAINILWHNNFFTNIKYKGYLEIYQNILNWINNNQVTAEKYDTILKMLI